MIDFKVPFAYDGMGNIVDVESAIKGKSYLCNCGGEVRLRGGDKVRNHFYHIKESECSYESAIHKAYKDVFSQIKKVKLPYTINGKRLLQFDKVDLELRLNDFQPDAIGYIGDDQYLIEFAKTSFIDKRKLLKIKRANLFCIEIEVKSYVTSIKEIQEHLVQDSFYKDVVHIPEYNEMKQLRTKFIKSYKCLEVLCNRYKYKADELSDDLTKIKSGFRLQYVKDCSNGAKLYRDEKFNFVAFQDENRIDVRLGENYYNSQKSNLKVNDLIANKLPDGFELRICPDCSSKYPVLIKEQDIPGKWGCLSCENKLYENRNTLIESPF